MRSALGRRASRPRVVFASLVALVVLSLLVSVKTGAVHLSTGQVVGALLARAGLPSPWSFDGSQADVLWMIRVPRVLLGAAIGAGLATSGAAMQGLFRNPLADPGLLGISSGASLGAVTVIVAGSALLGRFPSSAGVWVLPAAAFVAGLVATWLCVRVARIGGRARTAVMLLAGVAINALAWAGIGFFMHVANDAQLRNITFWMLGSLGGATWSLVAVVAPLALGSALALRRLARPLNALLLGEREAGHLGVDVAKTQTAVVTLTALAVGAAVAASGSIAFVGLVVPHACRFFLGPDHKKLLGASALLGAALLVFADTLGRTVVAPAELPAGVVTAAIGAPLFLFRLARARAAEVFA